MIRNEGGGGGEGGGASWVRGLYFYCLLLVIKRTAFKSTLDLHFYDL